MLPKNISLLLLAWIIPGSVHAQQLGYKSFKLVENNRPFKINTLYKTKSGYIQMGTTNGLYAFDGQSFIKTPFATPNITDTVTAIFEDNSNQLWVGFKNGHLAKKTNGLVRYLEPEEGWPKVAITSFTQDRNNNTWFSTNGEGVYYFKNKHLYLLDTANGLSDLHTRSLITTANGDILAATDQGLHIFRIRNNKIEVSVIGPKNGLPDYYVTSITDAGSNRYWIGMQDKGFCLYDHSNGNITIPPAVSNWSYGQINSLLVSQKSLWIATEENGLLQQAGYMGQVQAFFRNNLFQNKINNLVQDNEGNIWMNSNTELIYTAGNKLKLLPLYDKSMFESIHAILNDRDNNIWISSNASLIKYQVNGGEKQSKQFRFSELNSMTDITSLYQDANANIWIGTMGRGILLLNPATGRYRSLTENPLLKSASILSITGRGNTVCAGGLEGVAMIFTTTDKNKDLNAEYDYTNYNNVDNIGNNYIYCVYKDSKGRIWFGLDGRGISVLENGKFTQYNKSNGLKDDHIYSFTEDYKGNIWFNTEGAGIYCFDGKSFTNYNRSNGISDLKITALKTTPLGNVLLMNKKGFDILHIATGSISYYNNSMGIAEINTDMGSVSQDTAGNIVMSTAEGILIYSPVANTVYQPKTIIESIELLMNEINKNKAGDFKYDQNSLLFNFTGLYYTSPDEVRYQYKLEGLDTAWILTRDRNVSFLRLQPGKYKFHVRASLNEFFENADEATYSFVIAKPLWKRIWFISLALLTIAGLIYIYMKGRENRLKKMQLLEQEKIQFQFQVLRNQVNPHFLFNSFNTLISTIEENPEMAVSYVEQLSGFFRNIVSYRDKEVITIEEELSVLKTYFYLQQKRYGDNLVLNINISENIKTHTFIPPLTLQLLLENAIKHNAISKHTALTINLYVENEKTVVVENNLNPKITKEPSEGMGLQNIVNRYKLLSSEHVSINETDRHFIVRLPVLTQ